MLWVSTSARLNKDRSWQEQTGTAARAGQPMFRSNQDFYLVMALLLVLVGLFSTLADRQQPPQQPKEIPGKGPGAICTLCR